MANVIQDIVTRFPVIGQDDLDKAEASLKRLNTTTDLSGAQKQFADLGKSIDEITKTNLANLQKELNKVSLNSMDHAIDIIAQKYPKEFDKFQKKIFGVTDEFKILAAQVNLVKANMDKLPLTDKFFKNIDKDVAKAEETVSKYNKIIEDSKVKHVRLVTELRNMRNELAKMEQAGATGTTAYRNLQQAAAKLESTVMDNSQAVRALASDTANLDAGIGAIRGVVAAFTAYQGVIGLLGVKNEDFEKTLLKINGAMAILQSLQEISNLIKKESILRLKVESIALRAYNFVLTGSISATRSAAVANTLWANSFKIVRGALLATGIGALVIAIGYLIEKTNEYIDSLESEAEKLEKVKKASEELTQSYIERLNAESELQKLKRGGQADLQAEIALLKASGASFEEVFAKERQLTTLQAIAAKERLVQLEGLTTYEQDVKRITAKRRKEELEKEQEDTKKHFGKLGELVKFYFGSKEKPILPKFIVTADLEKELAIAKQQLEDLNKVREASDIRLNKERKERDIEYRSLEADLFAKSGEDYIRLVKAKLQAAKAGYDSDVLNYDEAQKKQLQPIRYRIYLKEVEDILREWRRRNDKLLTPLPNLADASKQLREESDQLAQAAAESIADSFSAKFKNLSPKLRDIYVSLIKDVFLKNIDAEFLNDKANNLFKKVTEEDVKQIIEGTKITLQQLEDSTKAKTDQAIQDRSDLRDTEISLIKDTWLQQKAEIQKRYEDEVRVIENGASMQKEALLEAAKKRRDNELSGSGLFGLLGLDKGQEALLQEVMAKTIDVFTQIADAKIAQDDREIASQEAKIARFKELAELGSSELLQLEEDRLLKMQQQREADVEKQRTLAGIQLAINQALAVSNGILAVIAAFTPPLGNPVTGVLTALALAATVASSIASISSAFSGVPAFREGTEYFDGVGTGKSDSNLARISRGERIVDEETNQKLAGVKNKDLPYFVSMGKMAENILVNRDMYSQLARSVPDIQIPQSESKDYTGEFQGLRKEVKTLAKAMEKFQVAFNVTEDGIEGSVQKVTAHKQRINTIANL